MNGSRVMPKIAGIESIASVISVISTTNSTKKQRRSKNLAALPHKKMLAAVIPRHSQVLARKLEKPAVAGPDILFLRKQHVHAGVHQKRAEDVHHPRKPFDQRRAGKNHHAAHHQRAQNPPFQHPVLKSLVDLECAKNHQEQKQIVYAEGLLDQIAGKKLNPTLRPRKMPDAETEHHRQRDPCNG